MKCKNLLVRKKNYKPYFFCKELRHIITLLECENCLKRNLARNRGIRKVSSKRVYVKPEIYNKVIERDNYCCKLKNEQCNGVLELHHIVYRSENKNLINDINNCIMLCTFHHKLVHSNKHYWQNKLKEIIRKEVKNENNSKSI